MITPEKFSKLALSFDNTSAAPHFDRIAFKVTGKRIFATLHEKTSIANLKFSPEDQSVFCLVNKEAIYRVDNKWGLQGWTSFKLDLVDPKLMKDALQTAYNNVFVKNKPKLK
ncbi:MAG: MmcQ/YjbR family DNA-binding protein [Chitinophagaceae bacterium]